MAKKFGKFVLATAVLTAVGAATYYYLQKKDAEMANDEEYEDYDDFSEKNQPAERSYVNLTPEAGKGTAEAAETAEDTAEEDEAPAEPEAESEKEKTDDFTPLEKVAQTAEAAAEETTEAVEEFFDEEDPSDEEPDATEV